MQRNITNIPIVSFLNNFQYKKDIFFVLIGVQKGHPHFQHPLGAKPSGAQCKPSTKLFAAHMFACKSSRWLVPFEGRRFLEILLYRCHLFVPGILAASEPLNDGIGVSQVEVTNRWRINV